METRAQVTDRALLRLYPALATALPWIEVCENLPTPVRKLASLGARLGTDDLWIKDDGLTDACAGGNKARILELVLPEAATRGRRFLACGPTSSNWVRAACQRSQLVDASCEAILFRRPSGVTRTENSALIASIASHTTTVASPLLLPVAILRRWMARGENRSVLLPMGGSSVHGALGYVNAACELAEQIERGDCPRPDRIYVPLGSGGTAAGLCVGLGLAGLDAEVVAVRVSDRLIANRFLVNRLARRTLAVLRKLCAISPSLRPAKLRVIGDQLGGAYGNPSQAGELAANLTAESEELILDPSYTAKTMAAIAAAGSARKLGGVTLSWHTLGAPVAANS